MSYQDEYINRIIEESVNNYILSEISWNGIKQGVKNFGNKINDWVSENDGNDEETIFNRHGFKREVSDRNKADKYISPDGSITVYIDNDQNLTVNVNGIDKTYQLNNDLDKYLTQIQEKYPQAFEEQNNNDKGNEENEEDDKIDIGDIDRDEDSNSSATTTNNDSDIQAALEQTFKAKFKHKSYNCNVYTEDKYNLLVVETNGLAIPLYRSNYSIAGTQACRFKKNSIGRIIATAVNFPQVMLDKNAVDQSMQPLCQKNNWNGPHPTNRPNVITYVSSDNKHSVTIDLLTGNLNRDGQFRNNLYETPFIANLTDNSTTVKDPNQSLQNDDNTTRDQGDTIVPNQTEPNNGDNGSEDPRNTVVPNQTVQNNGGKIDTRQPNDLRQYINPNESNPISNALARLLQNRYLARQRKLVNRMIQRLRKQGW